MDPAVQGAAVVHIVDDDASLRTALASLLRSVQIEVRTYSSADPFFSAERDSGAPACLLLDVRLPGLSGLDLQQRLREAGETLPVVLMTGHGDIPMSVRGMKAGAVDFLTKPFREQELLDAVHAALDRDRQRLARFDAAASERRAYATLSAREREVFVQVVAGRLNKQIAADLRLAEITVKIHRGAVMRKMGARSLPELVRMAQALGVEIGRGR